MSQTRNTLVEKFTYCPDKIRLVYVQYKILGLCPFRRKTRWIKSSDTNNIPQNEVTPLQQVLALIRAVYMFQIKLALLECVWQAGCLWA